MMLNLHPLPPVNEIIAASSIIIKAPYRVVKMDSTIPRTGSAEGRRKTRIILAASKKMEKKHTKNEEYLRTESSDNSLSSE